MSNYRSSGAYTAMYLVLTVFVMGGVLYYSKDVHDIDLDICLAQEVDAAGTKVAPVDTFDDFTVETIMPLLQSGSIKKIVETVHMLPEKKRYDIVKQVVDNSKISFNRNRKVGLIFGVAKDTDDLQVRNWIFELLLTDPMRSDAPEHLPLLYIAAREGFADALSVYQAWVEQYRKEHASLSDQLTYLDAAPAAALVYAVKNNQLESFKLLLGNGISLDESQATMLLWELVNTAHNDSISSEFLNTLVAQGARVNDKKEGKTPIYQAAFGNNVKLVQALIVAGAQVNLIANPAVGSALQVAIKKGYKDVELLLRNNGARE